MDTHATRRLVVSFLLGFSSGVPLLATGGTLQAWLHQEKVSIEQISLFALVGLPYTLKFLWAPFIDRFVPPFLGRRRGWLLITQLALMLALAFLGSLSPAQSPWLVAFAALLVTFSSASQDIVIDAHRRDTLKIHELGLGSSLYVNGYRLGMLISGGAALALADHLTWQQVYLVIAASLSLGIVATWFAPEPSGEEAKAPRTIKDAVVTPFMDFFAQKGALLALLFILLYKLGDTMAGSLTTAYFLELGFSKTQIGVVVKTFGLAATLIGGLLGGMCLLKFSMQRCLVFFGILQAVSTFGFILPSYTGPSEIALAGVIAFENITGGMGTSAFTAYMASLCNRRFSATQYALLSSLMGVPRVIISSGTGALVVLLGWPTFFCTCALLALPGLLLLKHPTFSLDREPKS